MTRSKMPCARHRRESGTGRRRGRASDIFPWRPNGGARTLDLIIATSLLQPAVREGDSAWADIGAGDGLFTRALARLLGPSAIVYAIDRDPRAVRGLSSIAASVDRRLNAEIVARRGDFDGPLALPPLDGILLANVLHFIPADRQGARLTDAGAGLEPLGRIVVIEYDNRPANRWVPYPVSISRLTSLAEEGGMQSPVVIATRPSAFGGVLYVALLEPAPRS